LKSLLTTTAIIEAATGLALVMAPSLVASSLLGTALLDPSAIIIAKLAGVALITIGFACWFSRKEAQSTIMVKTMLGYNLLSISVLVYSAQIEKISGQGLWPAVLLHVILLVWCFSCLKKQVK
jgi:predicted membrane-bound spermidine synthase